MPTPADDVWFPTGRGRAARLAEAFGAAVLEDLLLHRLRFGDQVGVRVLGAGDIVMAGRDPRFGVPGGSELTAREGSRHCTLGRGGSVGGAAMAGADVAVA